ncbi:CBS domain-containing protein CBSX1, chloroplastic-like [Typha latifolia]|uniref:CBS domain-containing protein CBSX1, chloroplastic-like n=1 Tax=Typha latifolia TaxID=4733 RepID=UPI003C2AF9F7
MACTATTTTTTVATICRVLTASNSPSFSFGHCNSSTNAATSYSKGSRRSLKPRASTFSAGSLRLELDENPEGIISGEWPENFSLLSYDDLRVYLESQTTSDHEMQGVALLGEAMSSPVRTATAGQTLEEIEHLFEVVSGIPVVDDKMRCVGVLSRTDRARASQGLRTKIGEIMSSPAITLSVDKTIMDAAALMLKMKIHRIPIVNEDEQVIGIVTRNDVLQELEVLLKM